MLKTTNKFSKEVKYSLLCLFFTKMKNNNNKQTNKQETMKIYTIFHSPPSTTKKKKNSTTQLILYFIDFHEFAKIQFVCSSWKIFQHDIYPKKYWWKIYKLRDANSSNVRKCVSIHRHFFIASKFFYSILLLKKINKRKNQTYL